MAILFDDFAIKSPGERIYFSGHLLVFLGAPGGVEFLPDCLLEEFVPKIVLLLVQTVSQFHRPSNDLVRGQAG